MAGKGRRLMRLAAATSLVGAAIGMAALTAAPVGAIREPMPDGQSDQYAQVAANGRQVVVERQQEISGCPSGTRIRIRATLSQASTGAFGEGTVDLACPEIDRAWRLTVDAASGAPAFSDGTAQASVVYSESVNQQDAGGHQWLGELTLVDQLPSDNPEATPFRDRLGAPWWLVIVLAVLSGVLLIATAGLLVWRGRRAGAAG